MKGLNWRNVLIVFVITQVFLQLGYALGARQSEPKPIPPVTDSEKMWLELNAMRKVQDAILLYVRPDDEHAKQFAKTLKEAGIPNLPGVR